MSTVLNGPSQTQALGSVGREGADFLKYGPLTASAAGRKFIDNFEEFSAQLFGGYAETQFFVNPPMPKTLSGMLGRGLGRAAGGAQALAEIVGGFSALLGGGAAELVTGGVGTPVALPVAIGGGAMAAHGSVTWTRFVQVIFDSGPEGSSLPTQEHHFATNKNKTYTPRIKEIADKYGLELDAPWNKELLPQLGRHPNEYHEFVLENMRRAEREAGTDKARFLELFEKYVKEPIRKNPELLKKSGWE